MPLCGLCGRCPRRDREGHCRADLVGRPTCFVIMGTEFDENGEEYYLLSRAEAQRRCRAQYLDTLEAGSVIPAP